MMVFHYLIIVVGCGILGLWKSARIKKRPRELREMIQALVLLDTEIYWGLTPLPEAFLLLTERMPQPCKGFFAALAGKLSRGVQAYAAWRETILEEKRNFSLEEEDWQVLESVGRGLGRSDRDEQHKQLELGKKHLEILMERASSDADKKAKMWSYLGFLSGLVITILMI